MKRRMNRNKKPITRTYMHTYGCFETIYILRVHKRNSICMYAKRAWINVSHSFHMDFERQTFHITTTNTLFSKHSRHIGLAKERCGVYIGDSKGDTQCDKWKRMKRGKQQQQQNTPTDEQLHMLIAFDKTFHVPSVQHTPVIHTGR